jgi:trehalose 6-phosphate phosphatase
MNRTRARGNSGPVQLRANEEHVVARAAHTIDVDRFMGVVARSAVSVLLLDYDGTLAPFSLSRQQAVPYPGMAALLQEIITNGRTRVVIITGRNADDVIPLLALHPRPEIWGSHGMERLRPAGVVERSRIQDPALQALADANHWLKSQGFHELAEFKTGAIAIHWRGLDEARAAEIRSLVLGGWSPIAQRTPMELLEFEGGIELRMRGHDKGDVVRTILDEIGPGVPVAYLGDDLTDERAFVALGGAGLSVLVRPQWRETAAGLWIRPPEGVWEFFRKWLEACRNGRRGAPR